MADHAHHHHTHHSGDDLAKAARTALIGSGEQWTTMRASVFDALAGFANPASAYDIADAVSKAQGRRVAANSVYRILDLFVGANVATRPAQATRNAPGPAPPAGR
jgi:Fur family zinc uptake transcriptional regulator